MDRIIRCVTLDEGPMADANAELLTTPLHALHVSLGAKMVPFAGYAMPVQYPTGILKEHQHTRAAAGLFDVSHMGQLRITGADPLSALERVVPATLTSLKPGRMRYTVLTADDGGILDDLIITNAGDHVFTVVNAGTKHDDIAHLRDRLGGANPVAYLEDRALLALQGPRAAAVLAESIPAVAEMSFMSYRQASIGGVEVFITRSGYTGEDGFEISVPSNAAEGLARQLLDHDAVEPIGLGARDSLRLEAGLCLYGHDIDTKTSPVEADLLFTIGKRRRVEGGFPGAQRILHEIDHGTARKRVGLRPEGRAPAREGTVIADTDGNPIGVVTSGGFGPTVGAPVAMGYVETSQAAPDTAVTLQVRGKSLPARVVPMPFVEQRYFKP